MPNRREVPHRPAEGNVAPALSALRPVAGVTEVQVVGALSDAVITQCALSTQARSVWIHPDVTRKLEEKRPESIDFILDHMADAIIHPQYCGLDPRVQAGRRIDLVHLVSTCGSRPLYVAVKVVRAADARSGGDELWVSTAYPLSPAFLTERRYLARFKEVTD